MINQFFAEQSSTDTRPQLWSCFPSVLINALNIRKSKKRTFLSKRKHYLEANVGHGEIARVRYQNLFGQFLSKIIRICPFFAIKPFFIFAPAISFMRQKIRWKGKILFHPKKTRLLSFLFSSSFQKDRKEFSFSIALNGRSVFASRDQWPVL